jgi:hypothetical protein
MKYKAGKKTEFVVPSKDQVLTRAALLSYSFTPVVVFEIYVVALVLLSIMLKAEMWRVKL